MLSLILSLLEVDASPEPERRGSGNTRKRNRFEVDRFNDYETKPVVIRNDDEDCLALLMMM